jgi:D-galactose 1-dehydrogenase
MANPLRIALVGVGKIARDQHMPAIAANGDFTLAAGADPHAKIDGAPVFPSLEALLSDGPPIDAVAICTPPAGRCALARQALEHGKHVLLEKPPGTTVAEVEALGPAAKAAGRMVFAAWHSRFAPGVAPARDWLKSRRVVSASIDWREDVRRWHPGQAWIWTAQGHGVFDAGINGLSIATAILPTHLTLKDARLTIPSNRDAPIAAALTLAAADGAEVAATLDWRQTGAQIWTIRVETDGGALILSNGGGALQLDGKAHPLPAPAEYAGVYRRFAQLIASGESDLDPSPQALVEAAFAHGRRVATEAFNE